MTDRSSRSTAGQPVWLPALVIGLAALLAGCGGSSAASPTVPAPVSQPTAAAAAVSPTVAAPPSATPTPASGATAQSAAPTADSGGSNPLTADPAVIRAQGFDASSRVAKTPDGSGNTLYAWDGVCHGSGDGHCQKMFFFLNTRYLGTDTSSPSAGIGDFRAAGTGSIAVTYPNYAKSDPLCCPSGQPVTITYHWNGTSLVPSGTPPGH